MATRDTVVIGASLGGIEALKELAGGLPRDLPAAVFIVQHTGPYGHGLLAEILARSGPLPVTNARDGEPIRPGHIYVAPPDRHLLLEYPDRVRVSHGPKENRTRPAVDPLFRSAAVAFGPRVMGVILTGSLDDGAAGLWAVKARGGLALVQDPQDALVPSMPLNALKYVQADHCVPLSQLAPLLSRLAGTPIETSQTKGEPPVSEQMKFEVCVARQGPGAERSIAEFAEPSLYACPECHGVLMQLKEGEQVRFRCHTGHAYSMESLMADFTERMEEVLWSSLRSIEETTFLLDHMAGHAGSHQPASAGQALRSRANEARRRADLVRQALTPPASS